MSWTGTSTRWPLLKPLDFHSDERFSSCTSSRTPPSVEHGPRLAKALINGYSPDPLGLQLPPSRAARHRPTADAADSPPAAAYAAVHWPDGDVARLAQIFANLLHNAAKFTEPGGNIWIDADRDGQQAVVRVKDDGVGIAPETLPRIFEPFYQADASLDRTREGMGVGLSLAQDLVQLHGSSIDARSEGPAEAQSS
jgi:anti-sigma regulatory factor (Ser/Thr protein kinase)